MRKTATLLPLLLYWSLASPASTGEPAVLATVADRPITTADLDRVIASSPVATEFPTMDRNRQARLRGEMLKQLVYAELLYQEALARGIDRRTEVRRELQQQRRNLLYQRYLGRLREELPVPEARQRSIRERYADSDARAAARAAYRSREYARMKAERLRELARRYHLVLDAEALTGDRPPAPDTVLARAEGIEIRADRLPHAGEDLSELEATTLAQRLQEQIEARLMARAGNQEGIDVEAELERYRHDLIAQIAMQERERAWTSSVQALRDYYQAHPAIGHIPEQWHVGQLVVATRQEAEALRKRILAGESLFRLAAGHSIDPYGREHAGDMGWLTADTALPALRSALRGLTGNAISPIVETSRGFHIVTVLGRRPEERRPFRAVAQRVRRDLVLDHIGRDYDELSRRFPVRWGPTKSSTPPAPAQR